MLRLAFRDCLARLRRTDNRPWGLLHAWGAHAADSRCHPRGIAHNLRPPVAALWRLDRVEDYARCKTLRQSVEHAGAAELMHTFTTDPLANAIPARVHPSR